ncbi:hypothetical protein Bca4012_040706 [Brassica carinata]
MPFAAKNASLIPFVLIIYQLKQVSVERVKPPIKSKQDDKDSLLAQIPNKVTHTFLTLHPKISDRPRSQTGPKMNLRAAPILEKASTIRQVPCGYPSLCRPLVRAPSNNHQVLSDSECGSEYEEDVACGYPSLCHPLVRAPSNKHQVLSDSKCGSEAEDDVACGYPSLCRPLVRAPSNKHQVFSDSECDSEYEDVACGYPPLYHDIACGYPSLCRPLVRAPSNNHQILSDSEYGSDYEEEYLTVVPNPSLCRPLVCAPSNNHQVLSDLDCSGDEEDIARGYHIV